MYLKRPPLGSGPLTFGRRARRYPVGWILLYTGALLAALYVFWQRDQLRPRIAAMIGPPPTPTPTSSEVLRLAEEAYLAGKLDEAAMYYEQASQIEPDNLDILFAHARVLTLTQQPDNLEAALALADEMILLAPEDPRGHAARARALDWIGDYDQAALAALKAVELGPDDATAHAYLGEVYTDLGRYRQAREQLELAIRLDPYSVDARRNYAILLEHYGDYEGAIQQYLQALTLHPNLLDLLYGLARNYRGAGQIDQAVTTYNEIAIRTPDDPLPYIELGKTYFEIRDDAAAQEFFTQALSLYEAREKDYLYLRTLTRLAMVYFTRRNYEDAIATFEQAIVWGEDNGEEVPIEAYYVTASAYYYLDICRNHPGDEWRTGAVDRAVQSFDLYHERRMDDPVALTNILKVFVLCRDWATDPFIHTGAGFVNGFPEDYEEPCVYVAKPGEEDPCLAGDE